MKKFNLSFLIVISLFISIFTLPAEETYSTKVVSKDGRTYLKSTRVKVSDYKKPVYQETEKEKTERNKKWQKRQQEYFAEQKELLDKPIHQASQQAQQASQQAKKK